MVNASITQFDYSKDEWADAEKRNRQRWQECTCRPQDALLCPSCLEYNKEKYGDSIPFFRNGREVR